MLDAWGLDVGWVFGDFKSPGRNWGQKKEKTSPKTPINAKTRQELAKTRKLLSKKVFVAGGMGEQRISRKGWGGGESP